jgi:hypothetical protein
MSWEHAEYCCSFPAEAQGGRKIEENTEKEFDLVFPSWAGLQAQRFGTALHCPYGHES